jgi:beta-lactamase class A
MGTVFEQIQQGKLHEGDILSQDLSKLREKFHVATESGEPADQKITMTVGEALEKMITVSDNYAAWLLTEKIGLSNVSLYLKKNGFTHSKLGAVDGYPVTTAFDIMLFFEKLSKRELADKASTDKMITLLKRQRLNTKLPKYLPDEVVIAHKTGELEPFTHDAGIVYTNKGSYFIAVLSESTSRYQAEERIADVSEAAYIHFMKETTVQ